MFKIRHIYTYCIVGMMQEQIAMQQIAVSVACHTVNK